MAEAAGQITLKNADARVVLFPSRGRFDIILNGNGRGCLKRLTAGVTFSGGRTLTIAQCRLLAVSQVEGEVKAAYRCEKCELDLVIRPAERPSAFEICVAYTNHSGADVPVRALLPVCTDMSTRIDLGVDQPRTKIYRNGWHGDATSRVIGLTEPHLENSEDDAAWGDARVELKGLVRSSLVTQIAGKGFYLTAGFLSAKRQDGILSTALRSSILGPAFSAAAVADGKPIAPGRRYFSEPLYVSFATDYAQAFSDYASLLAERMEARRFPEELTGWSSRHCYYEGVTESDVIANVDWLSFNRERAHLSAAMVEDGWEADIGDWLQASDRFPRGMKALADDIRGAGLIPGISLSPFVASETSSVYRRNPDWFVKDADGAGRIVHHVRGKDVHALDLTNPYVLGHIADFIGKISHDWGYDCVTIDLVHLGAARGARRDNTKTRAQVVRRGLEIVRQHLKKDAYLIGCHVPFGSGLGIVDAMRVSADVSPNWSGDVGVLASSWALTRWWMHGLLWHNHPGCIILRDFETNLTSAEVATRANTVMLSGGLTFVSDRMDHLRERPLEILSRLFPASTAAGVPLDLYNGARPSVFLAAGDRVLIGVFNWDDKPRTFRVNVRKILGGILAEEMADYWEDMYYPIPSGATTVTLEAHESKVFAVKALPVHSKPG